MNSFLAREGGNLNKNFPNFQMPGRLPEEGGGWGGGGVEALISLVHNDGIVLTKI